MINKLVIASIISMSFLHANNIEHDDIMTQGKAIYEKTCISCHGAQGEGNDYLNLIVKPRKLSMTLKTEKQMYNIIKDGGKEWGAKSDIMPSFKDVLNEEQLQAVTKYITYTFNADVEERTITLNNQSEPEAQGRDKELDKWGAKIYNRNCVYCHGDLGYGDGVATKNPVDSIFPYDLSKTQLTKTQIFLYIKYGSKYFGTHKDDMPGWGKKYSDFKLRAVARYIDEVIRK